MKRFAIAVHGGAGEDSEFIRENSAHIEAGLKDAVQRGHKVLSDGGTALRAVEEAVKILEDNPYFNAGRGSALNMKGEIEMDASIMCGKRIRSGAVSMVTNVKNPISLARIVMDQTSHVFLSAQGALELAKNEDVELEPNTYFVTEHQVDEFVKARDKETLQDILQKRIHGTVGAVALDENGNIAAATSTGGTENSLNGRIGDSCVIGSGCFANNNSCAISGTGDGEYLINHVIANTIAIVMEMKQCSLQEACDYVIFEKNADIEGDIGVIGVDPAGNIAMSFNSERLHRASIDTEGNFFVKIYK